MCGQRGSKQEGRWLTFSYVEKLVTLEGYNRKSADI